MADICGDNRFELIEKYKQKLLDATNIEDSPEEMAVIDNILFRFWQMGWLKGELFGNSEQLESDHVADSGKMVCGLIRKQAVLDAIKKLEKHAPTAQHLSAIFDCEDIITALPPAQPEYEPVKVEDFAKTMSENTIYTFMAWHGEALALMERHGFVICKKTM